MAKKKSGEFHIEQGLSELKAIVNQLEQQQLSLDEALAQFERGIAVIRQCQHALDAAEQKVSILLKKDGETSLVPFTSDEE